MVRTLNYSIVKMFFEIPWNFFVKKKIETKTDFIANCFASCWIVRSAVCVSSTVSHSYMVMFHYTKIWKWNANCLIWFFFVSFRPRSQSLVIPEKFQHILRIMNTNIDGNRKVTIAMTAIKGVGRRYANIVLKKADVDLTKRAGECTEEEVSIFTCCYMLYHRVLPIWRFLHPDPDTL